jgi:geranylgeranyl diphosphate synthase type I
MTRTVDVAAVGGGPGLPADPLDVARLRDRVHRALGDFMADAAAQLAGISPLLAPAGEALTEFLAGGKRLRPAFAYWGWRGAGGADTDAAVAAAASLELLQAAALIHDDLMDDSDTRRGRESVHRRFARQHGARAYVGPAEAFGAGTAILLGDLCLVWADEMLYGSGLGADALARARAAYDAMRTELMAGQYLDLLEQARGGGSAASAMTVLRYKSAKYTVERPLQVGAALAGADAALLAAYSAYGLPLGEAFQLRDDVLGVFGDPDRTGKPAGDDVREGKRTVLVATALERADDRQAGLLRAALGDRGLGAEGLADVRAVITGTGALGEVEALIDRLTSEALAALATADVAPEARAVLQRLASAATERTA